MRYNTRYRSFNLSSYLPTGVKWLLISNVAIFLLGYIGPRSIAEQLLMFSLVPVMILKYFAIWQLFTYMFLHGGLGHIFFNMLTLWFIGIPLERDWGTRRFLKYYFFCGVGAGICVVAMSALFGEWNTRTLGASGAILGLLLAFGILYANQTVMFDFVFPMKAKYMVMIIGGLVLLNAFDRNSGVSNVAHLGGMAFGYAYLRMRFFRVDVGYFKREYDAWKLRRAKKRFQVYLRKHGSDRDTFVN